MVCVLSRPPSLNPTMSEQFEATIPSYIIFSNLVIKEQGSNKLSLIGTFQHFIVEKYPFRTPHFFVTVTLTNLRGKLENEKVTVRVEQQGTGFVLCSLTADLNSSRDVTRDTGIEVPFPIPHMLVPAAGLYDVVVLLNNNVVGQRPIAFLTRTGGN